MNIFKDFNNQISTQINSIKINTLFKIANKIKATAGNGKKIIIIGNG